MNDPEVESEEGAIPPAPAPTAWTYAALGGAIITMTGHAALVFCGAADNVSVVIRHTIVQLRTPDEKRGRVSAVNSGLGTILIVIAVALLWPEMRRSGRPPDG